MIATYMDMLSYGYSLSPNDFNRFSFEAAKIMQRVTTGIDGYKKLKEAFPTDPDDAEAVKRCFCKLIDVYVRIDQAESRANAMNGYTVSEDGTVRPNAVSSVSSGSESISYSNSHSSSTMIDAVLSSKEAQAKLLSDTIREYLSGVRDKNGVNLLFVGRYPRCTNQQ